MDFANLEAIIARAATAESLVQFRIAGAALQESFVVPANAEYGLSRGGLEACVHVLRKCPEIPPRRQAAFAICNLCATPSRAAWCASQSLMAVLIDVHSVGDLDESTMAYILGSISHMAASGNIDDWDGDAVVKMLDSGCKTIQHPLLLTYVVRAIMELARFPVYDVAITSMVNCLPAVYNALTAAFLPTQRAAAAAVSRLLAVKAFAERWVKIGYVPVVLGMDLTDGIISNYVARILFCLAQHGHIHSLVHGATATTMSLCFNNDPVTSDCAATVISILAANLDRHEELIQLGVVPAIKYILMGDNPLQPGVLRLLACMSVSKQGRQAVCLSECIDTICRKFAGLETASIEYVCVFVANCVLNRASREMLCGYPLFDQLFQYGSTQASNDDEGASKVGLKAVLVLLVQMASSEQYHVALMLKGALGMVNKVLAHTDGNIRILATSALANLSTGIGSHEYLIRAGCMQSIIHLLDDALDEVVQAAVACLIHLARNRQHTKLLVMGEVGPTLVRQFSTRKLPSLLQSMLNLLAMILQELVVHDQVVTVELGNALLQLTKYESILLMPSLQCISTILLTERGRICMTSCFEDMHVDGFSEFVTTLHSTRGESRLVALRCLCNLACVPHIRSLFSAKPALRLVISSLDGAEDLKHYALACLANVSQLQMARKILLEERVLAKLARILRLRNETADNQKLASRCIALLCSLRTKTVALAVQDTGIIPLATNMLSLPDDTLMYCGSLILLSLSWNRQCINHFIAAPESLRCIPIMAAYHDSVANRMLCSLICTLSFLPAARPLIIRHHHAILLKLCARWLLHSDTKIRRMAAAIVANLFELLHVPLLHTRVYFAMLLHAIAKETDPQVLVECLRAISNALQRPAGLTDLLASASVRILMLTDTVQGAPPELNAPAIMLSCFINLIAHQRREFPLLKEFNLCKGVCSAFFRDRHPMAHYLWANVTAFVQNVDANSGFPVMYLDSFSPWVLNCVINGRLDVLEHCDGIKDCTLAYENVLHLLEACQAALHGASHQHSAGLRLLLNYVARIAIPNTLDVQRLVHGMVANGTAEMTASTPAVLHSSMLRFLLSPFDMSDKHLVTIKLQAIANVVAHKSLDWNVVLGSGLMSHIFGMLENPDLPEDHLQHVYRCISAVAFNAPMALSEKYKLSIEHHLAPLVHTLHDGVSYHTAPIVAERFRAIASVIRYVGDSAMSDVVQPMIPSLLVQLQQSNFWNDVSFRRAASMLLQSICGNRRFRVGPDAATVILHMLATESLVEIDDVLFHTMDMYAQHHTSAIALVGFAGQQVIYESILRTRSANAQMSAIRTMEKMMCQWPDHDWLHLANLFTKIIMSRCAALDGPGGEVSSSLLRWFTTFCSSTKRALQLAENGFKVEEFVLEELKAFPTCISSYTWQGMALLNNLLCNERAAAILSASQALPRLLSQFRAFPDIILTILVGTALRYTPVVQSTLVHHNFKPSDLLLSKLTSCPAIPGDTMQAMRVMALCNFSGHGFLDDVVDPHLLGKICCYVEAHREETAVMMLAFEAIANVGTWESAWQADPTSAKRLMMMCNDIARTAFRANDPMHMLRPVLQAVHALTASIHTRDLFFSSGLMQQVLQAYVSQPTESRMYVDVSATASILASASVADVMDMPMYNLPLSRAFLSDRFQAESFVDATLVGNFRIDIDLRDRGQLSGLLSRIRQLWDALCDDLKKTMCRCILNVLGSAASIEVFPTSSELAALVPLLVWTLENDDDQGKYCCIQTLGVLSARADLRNTISSALISPSWEELAQTAQSSCANIGLLKAALLLLDILKGNCLCKLVLGRSSRTAAKLVNVLPNGFSNQTESAHVVTDPLASLGAFTKISHENALHPNEWVSTSIANGVETFRQTIAAKLSVVALSTSQDKICHILRSLSARQNGCASGSGLISGRSSAVMQFCADICALGTVRQKRDPDVIDVADAAYHHAGWMQKPGLHDVYMRGSNPSSIGAVGHEKLMIHTLLTLASTTAPLTTEQLSIMTILIMHVKASRFQPSRKAVSFASNNLLFGGNVAQVLLQTFSFWQLVGPPKVSPALKRFDIQFCESVFRMVRLRGLPILTPTPPYSQYVTARPRVLSDVGKLVSESQETKAQFLHGWLCDLHSPGLRGSCEKPTCISREALARASAPVRGLFDFYAELEGTQCPQMGSLLQIIRHFYGPHSHHNHATCAHCDDAVSLSRPIGIYSATAFIVSLRVRRQVREPLCYLANSALDTFTAIVVRCGGVTSMLTGSIAQKPLPPSSVLDWLLYLCRACIAYGIQLLGPLELLRSGPMKELLQMQPHAMPQLLRSVDIVHREMMAIPGSLAPVLPFLVFSAASLAATYQITSTATLYPSFCHHDHLAYEYLTDDNAGVISQEIAHLSQSNCLALRRIKNVLLQRYTRRGGRLDVQKRWLLEQLRVGLGDPDSMTATIAKLSLLRLLEEQLVSAPLGVQQNICAFMFSISLPMTHSRSWDTSLAFTAATVSSHAVMALKWCTALKATVVTALAGSHYLLLPIARRALHLAIAYLLLAQHTVDLHLDTNGLMQYLLQSAKLPEHENVRHVLIIAVALSEKIGIPQKLQYLELMVPFLSSATQRSFWLCLAVVGMELRQVPSDGLPKVLSTLGRLTHEHAPVQFEEYYAAWIAIYSNGGLRRMLGAADMRLPIGLPWENNAYLHALTLFALCFEDPRSVFAKYEASWIFRTAALVLSEGDPEMIDITTTCLARLGHYASRERRMHYPLSECAQVLEILETMPNLPASGVLAILELRRMLSSSGALGKIEDLVRDRVK